MELTGKAKKDFEKWQKDDNWFEDNDLFAPDVSNLELFYELPQSMQYGVYVDFFLFKKSWCIYIKQANVLDGYSIYIDDYGHHILDRYVYADTLYTARIRAIKKANELYND